MGSGNSQLNPSEIKIDDRLSQNNTIQNIQPGDTKTPERLITEKTRIILSINNDNTVRISAAKSCATQTDETEFKAENNENGLEVVEQPTENSSAPIETKENQGIQADLVEQSEDEAYSTKPTETNLAPAENLEKGTHLYTETDNEAAYSTDIGFKTDDDIENEPSEPKISWGDKSVDSALTLHEAHNESPQNDEGKDPDTLMDLDNNVVPNKFDDTNQARPFDEVTLEKYGKYKIRMSGDEKNCIASSTAFLATGDAVIIDRSNQKIKFVDKQFQFISAHDLSAKPWAVCTSGTDVYVTMGNTQIQHLVVEDMIIKPTEVIEVKGRCLGICILNAHLAVGLQIGEICLLDVKGVHQGNITLPLINKKPCNPWHLSSTSENNVLVTDSDAGRVYCVSKKSELIFQYEGIDTPRATVLDNENNIVVVGRDKRSGDVVTLIHRDVELQSMLHIKQECKTDIASRTLVKWEELEFVPYSVCYRKDRIIVFGGIQETLKIMKLW